jgi:imidazolonepropionase-like amidohydrolase
MRKLWIVPCFLLGACAQTPTADLAIRGVTIVDVTDGSLSSGQTVLVEGDRIVAVGPVAEVAVPDDAEVVDAPDGYLIPGLWDMHAHTMSIPIARDILFPLFIANGVTGIRTMKTDCFESEQPDCVEEGIREGFADPLPSIYDIKTWREEIQAGTLIGPRIVAGSAMLDGTEPDKPSTVDASTPFKPATAEHARQHARILKERGVDFAKIYNFIPRDAYFAFTDEANRLGLPFAGHVPEGVRASEASEASQRSIEHAGFTNVAEECSAREDEIRRRLRAELESDEPQIIPIWLDMVESYDAAKCAKVFATLVRNGTWYTPTLVSGESHLSWREDPRLRYVPREEREFWSNTEEDLGAMGMNPEQQQLLVNFEREVTLAVHRAGVPLLAGSDIPAQGVVAGFGLHDELEKLVAIGLTEAEALRTATLEPARYLDAVDTQGTVEVGKVADLVLLSANPLEDIANTQKIEAVVARGRFFDREALDEILENVARVVAEMETGKD